MIEFFKYENAVKIVFYLNFLHILITSEEKKGELLIKFVYLKVCLGNRVSEKEFTHFFLFYFNDSIESVFEKQFEEIPGKMFFSTF